MTGPPRSRNRVLRVIAVFKFCKAILLVIIGLGALKLVQPASRDHARYLLDVLALRYDREWLDRLIGLVDGVQQTRLQELGVGAFAFAALFLVEGTGLWLEQVWASGLTVFATASFVPFEINELVHGVTASRLFAFVLNLAVVAYLSWALWRHSRLKHTATK
jgi:uncharacterized membrane protein (DUF2068 family)